MIFDASSIFKLVRNGEVDPLFGAATLDPAFYEVGNVLWKHRMLLDEISSEKQKRYFRMLDMLEDRMETVEPDRFETLELANEKEITFYDAAYLKAAEARGSVLVTEDRELKEAAEGTAEISPASDLT